MKLKEIDIDGYIIIIKNPKEIVFIASTEDVGSDFIDIMELEIYETQR